MKKRILSVLLIMSIITSIFAVSAATADAAAKPATPSVTIVNGGSANGLYVKWNSVGNKASYQVAYRPAGSYGCGQGYSYKTLYLSAMIPTEYRVTLTSAAPAARVHTRETHRTE